MDKCHKRERKKKALQTISNLKDRCQMKKKRIKIITGLIAKIRKFKWQA